MDISIIIPVYNSQKYLERCIKSVVGSLKLSKKAGEILLIDNESTDNSLDILKKYQKKYPKLIKVLSCKTPGASATRNYGVSLAKGKYIWFIDSDDAIAKCSIQTLLERADGSDFDLIMLGVSRVHQDGHSEYLAPPSNSVGIKEQKSLFIRSEPGPFQMIIRRDWWNKNNFKYKEGIIHEDMELLPAIILYTDNFTAIDKLLYYYYQNDNSVLHKINWDPHYLDIFPALKSLYRRFEEAGAVKQYHDELEWFFIWNLLVDSAKQFAKYKEGRAGFRKSRQLLREYFPNWRKNKFLYQKKISWKFRIFVNLSYFGILK